MLVLTDIELYTPRQVISDAVLVIDKDKVIAAGPRSRVPLPHAAKILNMHGKKALPGFMDIHTHGLLGKDAFSAELADVIQMLPRFGVTSFLATTFTLPMKDVYPRLQQMSEVLKDPPEGAECLGIHIEGNFLSPARTGMANPAWCESLTRTRFNSLQKAAGGHIKMVTFAPEEGQAMRLIPWLLEQSIIPSIGHSDATYEQTAEAVHLGLGLSTHTFNAMSPLHHRSPGVVGAVLAFPQITAQLIADGHHIHAGAMRALINAKGSTGVCLISDSAPFAALPEGTYQWEGYTLIVKDGTCRLPDGTLAGAYTLSDTGFRNLLDLVGLTPSEASVCSSEVPANTLHLSDRKGCLLAGHDADVIILDHGWKVNSTIRGERVLWASDMFSV